MARSYAELQTSIWSNADFLALDPLAQRAYILALSQRDLTACGVLPYSPKRWARLAAGTTAAQMAKSFERLAASRFVIIDHDTDEVWIRSFIRHDRVLKSPNRAKSMARSFGGVHSERIRDAILAELPARLREPFPEGFIERSPKDLGKLLAEGSTEPDDEPPPEPEAEGSVDHSRTPEPEALIPNPEESSSSPSDSRPGTASVDDDDQAKPETSTTVDTFAEACRLLADRALDRRERDVGPVGNARSWLDSAAGRARADHGTRAERILEHYPTISATALADQLEPAPPPKPAPGPPPPSAADRPDCAECESSGWVDDGDGEVRPCTDCDRVDSSLAVR